MLSLLELSDVNGKPKAKLDLPSPLRIGDRLRLSFVLKRQNAGRHEVLDVLGEFKVAAIGFDFSNGHRRQVLSVESVTTTPHWKAVKKREDPRRPLAPSKSPRKMIE